MAQTFAQSFEAARRVGAPLVLVRTPDNIATQKLAIETALTVKSDRFPEVPLMTAWDLPRGLTESCWPATSPHRSAQQTVLDAVLTKANLPAAKTVNPTESIMALQRCAPAGTILFLHNPHLVWNNPGLVQALANVRDEFKTNLRMVVLLVPLGTEPPPELKNDTMLIEDPLPDEARLAKVVRKTVKDNGLNPPEEDLVRATETVRGLSAFVAETGVAMALRSKGIDFDALTAQQKVAFESVKGVTLYMGTETLDDVVGLEGIKADVQRFKTAKNRVRLVVIFDEFEKMLSGSQADHGDNTGTAQRQSGSFLRFMQDHLVRGMILFGDPGTGKTHLAKALAKYLGCKCLLVELDKLMDSKLGASERNLNAVFDLILAAAGDGGALFLATCNGTAAFTTEMRRRFTRGTYYFGQIDAETRDAAWRFYCKKNGLDAEQPRPDDEGWTPAEIAVCCDQAYDYGVSLIEGARNVVPICKQQPEAIAERRRSAHGKLLDASTGRLYRIPGSEPETPVDEGTRTVMTLPD